MGGDVGADRAGGEIGFDNQRGLSDQLGGVQSRDVDPEDLPVLPVYDDLHQPRRFHPLSWPGPCHGSEPLVPQIPPACSSNLLGAGHLRQRLRIFPFGVYFTDALIEATASSRLIE
ncbi:MAG: hypothetical protein Q7O66_20330 [Dehalococcoidia bacterium]|nr:hypothetical protein [Dehalococcoidia bacterium]